MLPLQYTTSLYSGQTICGGSANQQGVVSLDLCSILSKVMLVKVRLGYGGVRGSYVNVVMLGHNPL